MAKFLLNQLPQGGSFGMDLLRLVVQLPEISEAQGKELVERLRQDEGDLGRRCLEWITEVMSRKFPDKGEREIRKMLGLAELEPTFRRAARPADNIAESTRVCQAFCVSIIDHLLIRPGNSISNRFITQGKRI